MKVCKPAPVIIRTCSNHAYRNVATAPDNTVQYVSQRQSLLKQWRSVGQLRCTQLKWSPQAACWRKRSILRQISTRNEQSLITWSLYGAQILLKIWGGTYCFNHGKVRLSKQQMLTEIKSFFARSRTENNNNKLNCNARSAYLYCLLNVDQYQWKIEIYPIPIWAIS